MFNFWKHKRGEEVITGNCLQKIPHDDKQHFEPHTGPATHFVTDAPSSEPTGNFGLSLLIGEVTGSAAMGMAMGGDVAGGILGAALSDSSWSDMGGN